MNKKIPQQYKPNEMNNTNNSMPPPLPELNSNNLNDDLINLNFSNAMLAKHHPRPSAVTSFNARLTDNGGGYTLWNRKQDNLRLILSNAFSQTNGFLPKNRCFTNNNSNNNFNDSIPSVVNELNNNHVNIAEEINLSNSSNNNNNQFVNQLNELNGNKYDIENSIKSSYKKRNTSIELHNNNMPYHNNYMISYQLAKKRH